MKYILYTTSKSLWLKEQADLFAKTLEETKGRGKVEIEVVHKIPKKVEVKTDPDGDIKPTWEWFKDTLNAGNNGVIFHFTPYYRKKWGITETIGGSRNPQNRVYPEFWVCAEIKAPAKGYPANISNFLRIMLHEQAHFDEDLDDELGNKLTQLSVHTADYKLKQIHKYHLLIDYRGKAFKESVDRVMRDVIKLVKKYV